MKDTAVPEFLPTSTVCGDCSATVFLDARRWFFEDERGGANNLACCARCGSWVLGIVGTREYVQRTAIKFGAYVALEREHLTH